MEGLEWQYSGMFPTSLKWQANTEAEWDMRQSLIRNGELVYTIYMAGCAVLLWYRASVEVQSLIFSKGSFLHETHSVESRPGQPE